MTSHLLETKSTNADLQEIKQPSWAAQKSVAIESLPPHGSWLSGALKFLRIVIHRAEAGICRQGSNEEAVRNLRETMAVNLLLVIPSW